MSDGEEPGTSNPGKHEFRRSDNFGNSRNPQARLGMPLLRYGPKLVVTCWCGKEIRKLDKEEIRVGRTFSCGGEACSESQGWAG